jgi:formate C-acetyltransferase
LSSEEDIRKFTSLVRAYFDLGGMEMQFNVVSTETLRDAQQHPDKYGDLVVRVAGYSALFVSLDKSLQDAIIARTQYSWN